jgi:hypothetical protein
VSPVRYELGFYIPEDDILHSHRHGYIRSYLNRETQLKMSTLAVLNFHYDGPYTELRFFCKKLNYPLSSELIKDIS